MRANDGRRALRRLAAACALVATGTVVGCGGHARGTEGVTVQQPSDAEARAPQALVARMREHLATTLDVAPASIAVAAQERVTWPDGSLGCPQPGLVYPQVLTPGWRVVLRARGEDHAYHAADSGQFLPCRTALPGDVPFEYEPPPAGELQPAPGTRPLQPPGADGAPKPGADRSR